MHEPEKPNRANLLEGIASSYVESRNGRSEESFEPLSESSLDLLGRIERGALLWASTAGLCVGAIIGVFEIVVMDSNSETGGILEQPLLWLFFSGFVLFFSGLEIAFLYWNGLRSAASSSRVAGLGLASPSQHNELLALALGRAALELPNPIEDVYGIDPYSRTSKWRVWLLRLLYKMKVGATSFFVRLFFRRILARSALRLLIPLMGGPVYAVWNGIITHRINRQIRARALAPHALEDLLVRVRKNLDEVGEESREVILAAVGEMIVRSKDAHPCFSLLVLRLSEALQVNLKELKIDWGAQKEIIPSLNHIEKKALLEAATLTSIVDGRVRRDEWLMLVETHKLCGHRLDRELLDIYLYRFQRGQPMFESGDQLINAAESG